MKIWVLFGFLAVAAAIGAQPVAALNRADYQIAERAFYASDAKQHFEVPLLLIAAGHFNGMSTGAFGPRLFKAIQEYQSSLGAPQTGWLTPDQLARLRVSGYGAMSAWGMTEI
ncbi:peptidoglycan-binding domain-containing protein [Hansschlegelia plantiphila]|uniref:Peptidoglycan binding-like domain-containing protein n=1 Tax=Hansschlegelia plantiphila TaxID=374655 RepID=A0A9W6J051_9HYPH|nr:peptidoglycan-binding domain-containing protein [Hansschlegelia plantiphila]GLK68341.1 hypothetical protein GCM10008179_19790 [Hansschlegelia plantiphila]